MVKEGRRMTGKPPISSTFCSAPSMVRAVNAFGTPRPMRPIAALKRSRSSAFSMASGLAPMSSTPCFSSTPRLARVSPRLSAVCPPSVGRSASGFSRSMIASTTSGVSGST